VIIDMAQHMGKDVLAAGEHFGEGPEITRDGAHRSL